MIKILTLIILSIIFRIYLFHVCYADDNSVYAINGSRAISQYNLENRMGTQVVPPVSEADKARTVIPPHAYLPHHKQSFAGISGGMNNELMQFWHTYRQPYHTLASTIRFQHQSHFPTSDAVSSSQVPPNPSTPAVPSLPEAIPTIPVDSISARISQAIDDFWGDLSSPPLPKAISAASMEPMESMNPANPVSTSPINAPEHVLLSPNIQELINSFPYDVFADKFLNGFLNFETSKGQMDFIVAFMSEYLPNDIIYETKEQMMSKDKTLPMHQFIDNLIRAMPLETEPQIYVYSTVQAAVDTYLLYYLNDNAQDPEVFMNDFNSVFKVNYTKLNSSLHKQP